MLLVDSGGLLSLEVVMRDEQGRHYWKDICLEYLPRIEGSVNA